MNQADIEQTFFRDIAMHKMTVLRDNGVNRHLRFRREGSSSYCFDIVTWHGHLAITGDMGADMFFRLNDMLAFFRTDTERVKHMGVRLCINPDYWAEKLVAIDRGGYKKYSAEIFKAAVKFAFDGMTDDWTPEKKDELWEEVENDVLAHADDEHEACRAAYNFEFEGTRFEDFYENNMEEPTFHYIWRCFAIAWAIEQYDKHKTAGALAATAP